MQPTQNNLITIPRDPFCHVLDKLNSSKEFISLAGTCKYFLIFFKELQSNVHFQQAVAKFLEEADKKKKAKVEEASYIWNLYQSYKNYYFKPISPWENNLYGNIFSFKSRHLMGLRPDEITREGLQQAIHSLSNFFPHNMQMDVQSALRNQLISISQGAFLRLADLYLNCPTDNTCKFQEIKDSVKTRLERDKARLIEHLTEIQIKLSLLPPKEDIEKNYFDFRKASKRAEGALENGLALLCQQVSKTCVINFDTPELKIAQSNVRSAESALKRVLEISLEWDEKYCKLDEQLGSTIDKLKEIDEQLSNLDACAQREAQKLGDFFNELSIEVTEQNQDERLVRLAGAIGCYRIPEHHFNAVPVQFLKHV